MPTLQQITCSIELSQSRIKLKEYGARYHNAAVEVFVAVPDEKVPFCVHISTEGYIAPGLAFFVFIDGEYHANRNRRRLRIPGPGVDKKYYEIDTVLRQKEEKIKGGGFIGRDWVFNELKIANADTASPENLNYIHNVGTIEVVVLRCKPDPPSPPRVLKESSIKRDAPAAVSASHHTSAAPPAKAPSAKATPAKAKTPTPAGSDAGFGGMFGLFDGANDLQHVPIGYDGANDLPDLSMAYDGTSDPLDQARVNMILNARPTLNLAHPELSSPLSYYFDQYAGGGHRRGTSEPTVYTINTETTRPAEALFPPTPSDCSQTTEEIKQALYEANRNDPALQYALSQPLPDLLDTDFSPQHSSRDQISDRLSPRENPQVDGDNGTYPQTHIHQPWDSHGRDDDSGDRYFGLQGKERDLMREKFRQQGVAVSPPSGHRVGFSPRDEVFNLPFHPRREQNMKYYQKFKDPVYLNVDVLDIDPIAAHDKGLTFDLVADNYEDTVRHMTRIYEGLRDEREVYKAQHDQTPPGRIKDAVKDTIDDLCHRAKKYAMALDQFYKLRDTVMKGTKMRFPPSHQQVKEHSALHQDAKASSQQQWEQQPQKHSAGDGWNQTGQGTVDGGQQLNQSWSPALPRQQTGHPGPSSIAASQKTEEHFDDANHKQRKTSAQGSWGQSHQQYSAPAVWDNRIGGQTQQRSAPDWQSSQQPATAAGWNQQASTQPSNDGGWNQAPGKQNPNGGWGSGGDQQQTVNQWGGSQTSNRSQSNKQNGDGWASQEQSGGANDAWPSNEEQQNAGAWGNTGDNNVSKSNSGLQKGGGGWNDDSRSNASHRSRQSHHASNRSAVGGLGTSASQQKENGGNTWDGDHAGQNDSWGNNDGFGGQKANSNKGWDNRSQPGSKTQVRDFAYAQRGPASESGGSTSGTPVVKPYFADWQKPSSPQHDPSDPKKRETARPVYQYPAKEMPTIPAGKTIDVSHGVQVGKGARYTHETGRPEYIDSMQKPFAVFSFKYRSKGYLENLLKRPITTETEPVDEAALKDKLLNLPRHKLVEELMMARGALPGYNAKASPASLKSAMKKSPPSSEKPASDRWGGKTHKAASNGGWGGEQKASSNGGCGGEQKAPSNGGWGGEQKAASNGGWGGEQKAASDGGWGGEQKAASNGGWGGEQKATGDAGGWDGADDGGSRDRPARKSQGGNDGAHSGKAKGGGWSNPGTPAAAGGPEVSAAASPWFSGRPAARINDWSGNAAKQDGAAGHEDFTAMAFAGITPPADYVDGKEPSVATGYEDEYMPEEQYEVPPPGSTPWKLRSYQ